MPHDIWPDLGLWSNTFGLVIAVIVCLAAFAVSRRPAPTAQSAAKKPKPSKSLTFRVDDIPIEHAENFDRNLQSVAELDESLRGAAVPFVRRSLERKDQAFMCATVLTTTRLSGKELCTRLSQASKDYHYSYSCDFDGITPMFEDVNGVAVDIIAVPGLGSHALGSWKSTNSDKVWLLDFLPHDVPNIRVLLYGYDTTLPGSLSKQSIEDLGGTLVERVVAFRARDGALIRARKRPDGAIADLAKACYALLFFGVPNLGLRNDQLRTLVQGQPNEALMHDLLVDNDSEASTFLKRLADQFSESCKNHYRVMSFFERMLSPTLEVCHSSTKLMAQV
ncbi:uncharacterized protein ColSpa_06387 [Colletotrichum spaethianum]|uniref:Uncharacterized protein n=1 Tax=Colletotrichum spaethianum TaxID=700344 RepID=A0AA37P6E4_9PEZI|nr:uncharacterized protein ColSpa_06387 [Colletotrichum spaethianum]GKT46206.1 hypothetical protein ColSpa_06387 [Colletotrichum spaethianum]